MKRKSLSILLVTSIIIICIIFSGCSSSKPEDEILGTWEWTKDIDFGEDIGTVHQFSEYVFEKDNGEYLGSFTFSGLSEPITIDFSYKIENSKLILTYLNMKKEQIVTHDITINKNTIVIGEEEYEKK